MAEAVFNRLTWEDGKFFATSCGIYADGVSQVSENARIALMELGISFNAVSTPVSEQIIKGADTVICMTESHASTLLSMFPQYAGKIFVMPKDISDPYGGNLDVYRKCRDEITECVKIIINTLSGDSNA